MNAVISVAITATERVVVVESRGAGGQLIIDKYTADEARRHAVVLIEKAAELERVSDGWPDIEGRE